MRSRYSRGRCGSTLLIVAVCVPGGACAQVALEEIVVTATKQATSVDVAKVPISISAYTQQDLDAQGIKSIADVAAMTPGINFTQQNQYGGTAQTNIEIRGVQSRTSAPTTAIYIDDTPLITRSNTFNNGGSLAYPQIFDLERVEVLRGPQGTLFGASAEGGAVRFIANSPSLTTHSTYARSELSGTRSGAPSYEGGVATGGPIIEGTLGLRVSAWYRQDGGWLDRCQPAVQQAGCLYVAGRNVNRTDSYTLRFSAAWAPTDGLTITPSVFYQRLHYHDGGGYEIALSNPSADSFRFGLAAALPATDPMFIPTLKIEANLGAAALTSVTSYVWRDFDFATDYTEFQDYAFFGNPYPLTGLANDFGRGDYRSKLNNLYQEVRLASTRPEARLHWVAGVYAESARQFDHAQVAHPDLPDLILARTGKTIEAALGVAPYLGQWVYWADAPENDKQYAAFGNADYNVTDTVKLSLGLRYAHFKTDTSLFLAGPFNGGNQRFAGSVDSNAFTPKAGITWQPDPRSTYYMSAGKGYRAGGVNAQTTSHIPGCDVTTPQGFSPDSLWSYEIGAKNRLFDRRLALDASAFYIDWRDIQNFTQIPQCGFGAVFNLGRAVSKGFDLSLQALLQEHFQVGLQLGYTDARFKDTAAVPKVGQVVSAGDAIAGASLLSGPAVPPWSVTVSSEYGFLFFGTNAYVSLQDIFHSRNNGPFSTKNPENNVVYDPGLPPDPSTNVLNLRFGVRGEHVDAMLFANNALNAHPQLSVNHTLPNDPRLSAVTLRPLTVGVAATLKY